MAQSSDVHTTYSVAANVSFSPHGVLVPPMSADCFLEINSETRKSKQAFKNLLAEANGRPVGTFTITDCCVIGWGGMVIDPIRQICWIGRSIGWNHSRLIELDAVNDLVEVVDEETILIASDWISGSLPGSNCGSTENAFLMAQPGFGIYGHWLIDVLPRLYFASGHTRWKDSALIAPAIPAWGAEMARAYGVDFGRHLAVKNRAVVRIKELSIFSCIKYGVVLDKPLANAVWDVLRLAFARDDIDIPGVSEKVYVSRSSMQTDRRFRNAQEIERYFRSEGWMVLYPEQLSLASQAAIFAQASVIAGDDGSALHNSIYSKPGTKILCMNFERNNMFHASVANVLEHKLAYLDSDAVQGNDGVREWEMPIPRLSVAIDSLERAQ